MTARPGGGTPVWSTTFMRTTSPAVRMFSWSTRKPYATIREISKLERRCAELALERRQTQQAKSHIEAVLKRMEQEGRGVRGGSEGARLEEMRGQANVLDSKFEEAAKDFALAIEHDPALHSSYLRLARLLRTELRTRAPKEADDLIEKLVGINPELGTAYLTRFQYNTEFHSPADDRDLRKALDAGTGQSRCPAGCRRRGGAVQGSSWASPSPEGSETRPQEHGDRGASCRPGAGPHPSERRRSFGMPSRSSRKPSRFTTSPGY